MVLNKRVGWIFCLPFIGENAYLWKNFKLIRWKNACRRDFFLWMNRRVDMLIRATRVEDKLFSYENYRAINIQLSIFLGLGIFSTLFLFSPLSVTSQKIILFQILFWPFTFLLNIVLTFYFFNKVFSNCLQISSLQSQIIRFFLDH